MNSNKEKLVILARYGKDSILSLESINLTPQEASDLMRTISQLVVGIVELREHES